MKEMDAFLEKYVILKLTEGKRFVWTYNLQPIGSAYFTNETKLTRGSF